MKRLITFIFILLLCSCNNTANNNENINITKEENTSKIDNYIDNNPITIGTYINDNNTRKLYSTYSSNWDNNIDIISIEVYFTNEEVLPTLKQKDLYNQYLNNYSNINNYKIGYNIKYSKDNINIDKNILSPKDTEEIFNDIQLYLYDDINNSGWYSHVTNEDYNDNTILSSIKLTNSTYTKDITSDIILTVFTYDSDDFDKSNNYRGNSKYSITIKRK